MNHNLILEVDGKRVHIEKCGNMWGFDSQEGEKLEEFNVNFYSLEQAVRGYIEGLEEFNAELDAQHPGMESKITPQGQKLYKIQGASVWMSTRGAAIVVAAKQASL